MSALSVSSMSSTVGSVRRMAVSSGRGQQELLAENVVLGLRSQSVVPVPDWMRRICLAWFHS